jgi:molecular chaperone HtpG
MTGNNPQADSAPIPFKAETRQILDILIHSLYSDRDVFLRELISNASDSLTRIHYEMLTNRNVLDPEAQLGIWIRSDPAENTITIQDTGIGMTADEMAENLGTIAHSGARAFLQAAKDSASHLSDIIGQFGVGFYSAFMVAEWIHVTSRSNKIEESASIWQSTGSDTFTIAPAEKADRGTIITVKLKDDEKEFTNPDRLRAIVHRYSDFIPFPIFIGESTEQVNRQTSLWRTQPSQIEAQQYDDFYHQFSLDIEPPLEHIHMLIDAPVQLYALLFIPTVVDRHYLSSRKQEGLKLYARKVLIQEYCLDLLPESLRFIDGIVDSEDLPLNVSRESFQANRVITQIKKVVTNKVIDTLKNMAKNNPDQYERFWKSFSRSIKQGVATDPEYSDAMIPLLRFHTMKQPEKWVSFEEYVLSMPAIQKDIYYILGSDNRSVVHSPHLEPIRKHDFDVLLMTEPIDPLLLLRMTQYEKSNLVNAASKDLKLPELQNSAEEEKKDGLAPENQETYTQLCTRIKEHLGEKISAVCLTEQLEESPARLIDPEGALSPEIQQIYRMMDRKQELSPKVLEINPHNEIIQNMASLSVEDPLFSIIVDQLYENALLIEGLHPDPASMISRVQQIMQAALKSSKI